MRQVGAVELGDVDPVFVDRHLADAGEVVVERRCRPQLRLRNRSFDCLTSTACRHRQSLTASSAIFAAFGDEGSFSQLVAVVPVDDLGSLAKDRPPVGRRVTMVVTASRIPFGFEAYRIQPPNR